MSGASNAEENNVNLITRSELRELTEGELAGLFARISRELAHTEEGSVEWHSAMLSLENIRHEQAARRSILRPLSRGPAF